MRKKYLIKRACGSTLINGRIDGEDIIDLKLHVPKASLKNIGIKNLEIQR